MVRILLKRQEISPDTSTKADKTPFLHFTISKQIGVVKIPLTQEEVVTTRSDNGNCITLKIAEMYSHKVVVELLKSYQLIEMHGGKEMVEV